MKKIMFERVVNLNTFEQQLPSLEFTLFLTDDGALFLNHQKLPLIVADDEVGVITDKNEIIWFSSLYDACYIEYPYSGDYISNEQENAMSVIANHISNGYGEDLELWLTNASSS